MKSAARRIVCLIDYLGAGGAQRQMVGLASLLKERGDDVTVVVYYDNTFYKPVLDAGNVEYVWLTQAANKWRRIGCIYRYLKTESPDVVISYLDTPSIVACVCRLLMPKAFKLIVSERNTTQVMTLRERFKFLLYRIADKVVCNSYSQGDFIRMHCPSLAGKTTVITNFVDLERFKVREAYPDNGPIFRMVCVGRVSEQKNVLNFIDAIRLVSQRHHIEVAWYGSKDDEYYVACEEKVKEYGLEEIITFHEPVVEIEKIYYQADVFCLPSIYEGFPNVLCEAMSCGLPVLCSRVCDNPRIVEDGHSGFLFNPNDVNSIVRRIERYIALPVAKREELARNARRWIVRNMSTTNFVERYLQEISGHNTSE